MALRFFFSAPALCGDVSPRRPRVLCCYGTELVQVRRRCSPVLESMFISGSSDSACGDWKAVPDIWRSSAERYGDRVALVDPYHDPPSEFTYKQLEQEILDFSEGLRVIGLQPDEKLALFADNSCRWLVADQGIMATGAINVVRGAKSSDDELFQIYTHSESTAVVVDNPQFFNRLSGCFLPRVDVKFVVLLWGDKSCLYNNVVKNIPVYEYREIVELGRESRQALLQSCKIGEQIIEIINPEDVATLMYTSGTSGVPKGVMLTHQNLLHQIKHLWDLVPAVAGDRFLSILPSWHAYERATEYCIFTHGIQQVYTSVALLKEDLQRYQPQYIFAVPLVYETLHSSIYKQIYASSAARKFIALTFINISLLYMEAKRVYEGKSITDKKIEPSYVICMLDWLWGRIVASLLWPLHVLAKKLVYSKIHSTIGISKAGVCGGGSLPMCIDRFFEAIGVKVQNGYGVTETSPVVAFRSPTCNVLGTIGHPMKETEIKVVDVETGRLLPDGSRGVVKVKGPQVMKGYYKNSIATKAALDEEGWFKTGDIGWFVPKHAKGRGRKCGGMLVLEGRAKDTIVLKTGENVDPSELEQAAIRSSLIQQIVVIGQDQRRLGAIIVPKKDKIVAVAQRLSILDKDTELTKEKMMGLMSNDLRTWTSGCSFQIGPILIADEPFTVDNGLMTPTMKIRREKVVSKYREQIADMYK